MASKVLASIALLALAVTILGASNAGVTALLTKYNVSSSTINAATYTNISYLGSNYVLVYTRSNPYFLVNTSANPYFFVLNQTHIASIISATITETGLSQINFATLRANVSSYLNSSAAPLNDCITETGTGLATCTAANYCQSCAIVPSCNKVLYATNGPAGVLGSGIQLFQLQYDELESNITLFNKYTNASLTSSANALIDVQKAENAFANISTLTSAMAQNPIFPSPASADLTLCGTFGNVNFSVQSSTGPWYCNSIGYCEFLTYNTTLVPRINVLLAVINAQLPTSQYVNTIALNISSNENQYIIPSLQRAQTAILNNELNTQLSGINVAINESSSLLSHVSNAQLSAQVSGLEANFSYLKSNYLQLNITKYAASLSAQLKLLKATYAPLNASFQGAIDEARLNTASLIALQLGGDTSNQTAALSYQQASLNAQLDSQVANLSALSAKLRIIDNESANFNSSVDLSATGLSRGIDAPFVSLIASSTGLSYPAAVAAAPAISSLLSFIIGMVILGLFYLWYSRLKASKKLRLNPRTARAWKIMFVLIFVIILAYVLVSYSIASAANSQAPESAFNSALHASKTLVIAINGTATQPMVNCAAQISAAAKRSNYTASTIYITGSECTGGNTTLTDENGCLSVYSKSNIPILMLSQSNSTSIGIYSLYGTLMSVSGNAAFYNACYVSYFISK